MTTHLGLKIWVSKKRNPLPLALPAPAPAHPLQYVGTVRYNVMSNCGTAAPYCKRLFDKYPAAVQYGPRPRHRVRRIKKY